MAVSSNILFFLLSLLLLLLKKVESQNGTNFSINVFTNNSLKLTYEVDATDEPFVRLTPDKSTVGRVLYKTPVTLWEQGKQLTFQTNITLQITPIPNSPVGEGMTFFIVPVNSTTSSGGTLDNLGIYDAVVPGSPVFAVEFDVAAVQGFNDPPYPHIGININSQRSQNTTRFDDATGQLVTARITYDAPTRRINVVATYGSTTATLSFVLNLAALLPEQVQLGLSASASNNDAAYFDAYTWHFNSTLVPDVNTVIRNDRLIRNRMHPSI